MKELLRTKTFWSGLALVAYGIVEIANGNYSEGAQAILTGLSVIFLRDAIRKHG